MTSFNNFDSAALCGRVAVITGANGSIGQAIVERLQTMGACVVQVDIAFNEAPELIEGSWRIGCDIRQLESIDAMSKYIQNYLGRCDVLVNNAAISTGAFALEDLSLEYWNRILDINLRGAFLCAQSLVPMMFKSGTGSIVNISSIASQVATRVGAYSTSKAGMLGLTHQMAVEWGPRGIRCNSISPGMVRTPLSEVHYQEEGVLEKRTSKIPLRRIGKPDDIANTVAFLSCDAASYINGQDLVVDGGFLKASLANLY